jgi:signal transduction histidine kinase
MQQEFINIAAHELRNPVQPILGLTEILISKIRAKEEEITGEKDDDDDIMDVIIRNATRLKQLTEDILDITTIENQALTLHKEQFCLNEVILHAITDTRNQLEKEQRENIRFMLNPEQGMDDLTVVIADKQRMTQVISNLLDNAVEFTKQGIINKKPELFLILLFFLLNLLLVSFII